MIETTVKDYLSDALPVPVALETPKGPPGSYVLIEKTGSQDLEGLPTATLAIQSIAPTLYGAASLNETVKAAMKGITALTNVFRCQCDGDYNFTNTQTKERRYQAVFSITYKE